MDFQALFRSLTLDDINAFVTNSQQEHLHLDFKLVNGANLGGKEDKKNLASAISGFANSAGGLIVWGVDARKPTPDQLDCVQGLKPVADARMLLARLNSLTGEATDPLVPGVEHRLILSERGGAGFALTMVPESQSGPHMAKLGENRYYKRAGDSFYPMEHYDISDMFGARRRPVLELQTTVAGRGSEVEILLALRNVGRAIARAPFAGFLVNGPLTIGRHGVDGNGNEGLPRVRAALNGYSTVFAGTMDTVIHPGISLPVTMVTDDTYKRSRPGNTVEIFYGVACDGQPLERRKVMIEIPD